MHVALLAVLVLTLVGCGSKPDAVRFATYNSALSRDAPGELLAAMRTGDDEQAQAVASVIQAVRPDVLVLQEFDHGGGVGGYDPDGKALDLFQQNYLAQPQANSLQAIRYEHVYLAPSNTGLPTGVDLNGDGLVAPEPGAEVGTDAYAADCHGWGKFPGQYAFVVLSKYPIDRGNIRTFQEFLWKDLPNNYIPPDYYSDEALDVLRLSSKNYVDVPIDVGSDTPIHVLAAHPTPPVFDGPEDRNGRRNLDELRLLALTLGVSYFDDNGEPIAQFDPFFPVDDDGDAASFPFTMESIGVFARLFYPKAPAATVWVERLPFLVVGDLNSDESDGESLRVATSPLVRVPFEPSSLGELRPMPALKQAMEPVSIMGYKDVSYATPTSSGGLAAAERDGGVNARHKGDPAADTADWDDERGPGNLRVDYVLPSSDLTVLGSGVFWPTPDGPLMGVDIATVEKASDHRLVWVDLAVD